MKRIATLALLLLATLAPAAPAPEEYSITVHVFGAHFTQCASAPGQWLDVVIDKKQYVLTTTAPDGALLDVGDYKAKLLTDEHKTSYETKRVYELLFPDQQTRKCHVVSQTE
jgi:hypothetical protein